MVLAAPLGCLMIWQRMAFFGDALAHASLLGIGLGLLLAWSPLIGAAAATVLFALILWRAERQRSLALDTWLGVMSHGALALGLLLIYTYAPPGVNLSSLLIGDILAVTTAQLTLLALLVVVGGAWLWWRWDALLLSVLSVDLAQAEGVAVHRYRLELLVLLAAVVALAIQWVGVLLMSSLLLIPASAARAWSRQPEQMVWGGVAIGWASVALGLAASWQWDWPLAPGIVVIALLWFVLLWAARRLRSVAH